MRKLWIDSDCASDDAMAMMMAFYHPDVEVIGISVVSGYRPASVVRRNPFIIFEQARVAPVPVYSCGDGPLGFCRELPEVHVHGEDGLGDLGIAVPPDAKLEPEHSAAALLAAIRRWPKELEIAALGPLTNLALAFRLDPTAAAQVKKLWIMGGTGKATGNISPVAEANIGGDPEAAQIVFTSGVDFTLIPLEAAGGDMLYSPVDLERLAACGPAGRFVVQASQNMVELAAASGKPGLLQADPAAMGIALWPELEASGIAAHCEVECKGELTCGMVVEDTSGRKQNNCHVVHTMDGIAFKQKVLALFQSR